LIEIILSTGCDWDLVEGTPGPRQISNPCGSRVSGLRARKRAKRFPITRAFTTPSKSQSPSTFAQTSFRRKEIFGFGPELKRRPRNVKVFEDFVVLKAFEL
jgi:hypothetical protein